MTLHLFPNVAEAKLVAVKDSRIWAMHQYTLLDIIRICLRAWKGKEEYMVFDWGRFHGTAAERRMAERLVLGSESSTRPTGLGRYSSESVLLIGDRPSPRWGSGKPNWPFISASREGCSYWLAEQLEAAQVPESRLYWMNAYTAGGQAVDSYGARHYFTRRIALGRPAAVWCQEAGLLPRVDYEVAPHPQYWSCFRSKEPYPLIPLLHRLLHS